MKRLVISLVATMAISSMAYGYEYSDYTWHSYNGHQYAATFEVGPWVNVQAEAAAIGENLVTINDLLENAWLTETFDGGFQEIWIGLRKVDGEWAWLSGEPITYWNVCEDCFREPGLHMYLHTASHWAPGTWNYNNWHDTRPSHYRPGIIEISDPSVEGRVIESETHNPVEGANLQVGSHSATTNLDGYYIFKGLEPDAYSITAAKSGYHTYTGEITVTEGATKIRNIELVPDTGKPAITSVEATYDKEGIFLEGISVNNTYTVKVDWNGTPGTVKYIVNGTEYLETADDAGASHTFDMGFDFTGNVSPDANTLKIIATNQHGVDSNSEILHPIVIPIPSWSYSLGDFSINYDINEPGIISFILHEDYPDDPFCGNVLIPSFFPYIGGSLFGVKDTQASLIVYIKSCATGGISVSGQTGFDAAGQQIIGSIGGNGEVEYSPGDGLKWKKAGFNLGLAGTISDQIGVVELIPALAGFANIPGIRWFNEKAIVKAEISPGVDFALNLINNSDEIQFDSFEGTGSIGSKLALALEITGDIEVELYGGGDSSVTMQFPKDPSYLKEIVAQLYAGLIIKIWVFTYNPEASHIWKYPESGESMTAHLSMQTPLCDIKPQIIQPTFLKYGPYSHFKALRCDFIPGLSESTSAEQVEVITNVYSYSEPVIAEQGGITVLAFVYYDLDDPLLQNTEIYYTIWNGSTFSTPGPILDDTRAEFNPQVAFDGNGNLIAVWERIKDSNFTSEDIKDMAAQMEIVYAVYSAATDNWSTPTELTNNVYLDHHPLLKQDASGDILLIWEENQGNELISNSISPSTINYSIWDGTQWSPSSPALSNVSDAFKFDVAYWGNGAILVWTQDGDGDLSTLTDQDISYSEFDGNNWATPLQLTNNTVPDSSPKVIRDSEGNINIFWHHGNEIVQLTGMGGTPRVVRQSSEEVGLTDFHVTLNEVGNLVLVWQSQDGTNTDIFYSVYDGEHDSWGKDNRLTNDNAVEKYFKPIFSSSGDLMMAYNRVETEYVSKEIDINGQTVVIENVPQPGRNDLYVLTHSLSDDLAFVSNSLAISQQKPEPDTQVSLSATVINKGDNTLDGIVVAFYDGDPKNGGVQINGDLTIPSSLNAGESYNVETLWTVPSDDKSHTIHVKVDPDESILEKNENNNEIFITMLLPDLSFLTSRAEWRGSFTVDLIPTIKNEGVSGAKNIRADFFKDSQDGDLLASRIIPVLSSGNKTDVLVSWPVNWGDFSNGEAKIYVKIDSENAVLESNEENNHGQIIVLERPLFPYCEGDFDTDGDVDGSDLAIFAADFGRTDCENGEPCEGDFDDDNDVDGSDLAVFAADFGRTDCPE